MENKKQSRYIDLTVDLGFKIAFGNPEHPELTLRLLQELIPEREIVDIELLDKEILSKSEDEKRYLLDVKCRQSDGSFFLVEMQKKAYNGFGNRLLSYSGSSLGRLLKSNEQYEDMRYLYVIAVLDHYLKVEGEKSSDRRHLIRRAQVRMEDTKQILSNRMNFIFLQLPMVQGLAEGQSFMEELAYVIRNIGEMTERPQQLKDPFFDKLFAASERQNIENDLLSNYDKMVRDEIQIQAEKDFAVEEAREQARTEERESIAAKLMELGVDPDLIKQATGQDY